jgi:hypothetical protein
MARWVTWVVPAPPKGEQPRKPHRATGRRRGRTANDDAVLGEAVQDVEATFGVGEVAAVKTVAGFLDGITNVEPESNRRRVRRAARGE